MSGYPAALCEIVKLPDLGRLTESMAYHRPLVDASSMRVCPSAPSICPLTVHSFLPVQAAMRAAVAIRAMCRNIFIFECKVLIDVIYAQSYIKIP